MIKSLVGARHAVLAVFCTVLALSPSTPARAAVPDGNITLEVIAVNGSGCAPGTATAIAHSDKTGFRIRYYDFVAEAGGTADPTDRRKNCQVGVLVTVPAGWTFAIAEAEYRGRARLQAGATGLQRTNYYWQGSSANNSSEETFTGPLNGYWDTSDVAPVLVYTPCGEQRVLNINAELRVDAGNAAARSSMSMRSSDGDVDTLFNVNWQRC
jgi:hypothetical protein